MAKQGKGVASQRTKALTAKQTPRSLRIAEQGIRTGADFADMMSSLMSDIVSGRVTPSVGNAACNAGGKLLKIVEMQYKYGTQNGTAGPRVLHLISPAQAAINQ